MNSGPGSALSWHAATARPRACSPDSGTSSGAAGAGQRGSGGWRSSLSGGGGEQESDHPGSGGGAACTIGDTASAAGPTGGIRWARRSCLSERGRETAGGWASCQVMSAGSRGIAQRGAASLAGGVARGARPASTGQDSRRAWIAWRSSGIFCSPSAGSGSQQVTAAQDWACRAGGPRGESSRASGCRRGSAPMIPGAREERGRAAEPSSSSGPKTAVESLMAANTGGGGTRGSSASRRGGSEGCSRLSGISAAAVAAGFTQSGRSRDAGAAGKPRTGCVASLRGSAWARRLAAPLAGSKPGVHATAGAAVSWPV